MLRHKKLRAAAILALAGLCVASIYWPKVSTIATMLLLYVTFEYLLVTQDNLSLTENHLTLFQRQIQSQERVELHFDLGIRDRTLRLRISNLGFSSFLLQIVHVRQPDKTLFNYDVHTVVQSGKTEEIELHRELYEESAFSTDLEITLEYVGLSGSGKTSPKCFNLFLGMNDEPIEIKEGLDEPWLASCPKCKSPVLTNVYGLRTFESAETRRNQLIKDIEASCPNHLSEWLLSTQHMQAEQRKRDHRRKL